MAEVISPLVQVVGYGPYLDLGGDRIMTPDEILQIGASATFKGPGVVEEFFRLKQEGGSGEEARKKKIKSVIRSTVSGHALATIPGVWFFLMGASSKLEGSVYTAATHSAALMPSGRRVPVSIENILVPKGIAERGGDAVDVYLRTSEANIRAYEELRTKERGVSKEDAAKLVQYGIWGGGLMFMPEETIVYFAKEIEADVDCIPEEVKESFGQLERFIHSHGMGASYEGRKVAPRAGCVNPNIFQDRVTFAEELMAGGFGPNGSRIVSIKHIPSAQRDKMIAEYLEMRDKFFSQGDINYEDSLKLLRKLETAVADFNNTIGVTTISNNSWRVWREAKRHRTLPQTVQSIYHAIEKATDVIAKRGDLSEVISLPQAIRDNPDNLKLWTERFSDSIEAYHRLIDMGVKRSDAVALIPRGIKVAIEKTFDLYNLTTGYGSLRSCSKAEPEMLRTTRTEMDLILQSDLPDSVKYLLISKCGYVGYCSEEVYCGNISKFVKNYDDQKHGDIKSKLEGDVENILILHKNN